MLVEWEILSTQGQRISLVFLADFFSSRFIALVLLISARVMVFRTSYMGQEQFFSRFLLILFLFILSIGLLILRPNLISILLG